MSVLSSSVLKHEIILRRTSELDQIVQVSGHDFIDFVDEYVVENMVDNLVLFEQLEQD